MKERRAMRTLAVCQICGLAPGLYVVWTATPIGHCIRCHVLVRLVDDEGVECPVPPLVAREYRALMARYWDKVGFPILHADRMEGWMRRELAKLPGAAAVDDDEEITDAMVEAGRRAFVETGTLEAVYRAMRAARPKPPADGA